MFAFCRQCYETVKIINCIQRIGLYCGNRTSLTSWKTKLQRTQHKIVIELKLDWKLSKTLYIVTYFIKNAPRWQAIYPCSECMLSLKKRDHFPLLLNYSETGHCFENMKRPGHQWGKNWDQCYHRERISDPDNLKLYTLLDKIFSYKRRGWACTYIYSVRS